MDRGKRGKNKKLIKAENMKKLKYYLQKKNTRKNV